MVILRRLLRLLWQFAVCACKKQKLSPRSTVPKVTSQRDCYCAPCALCRCTVQLSGGNTTMPARPAGVAPTAVAVVTQSPQQTAQAASAAACAAAATAAPAQRHALQQRQQQQQQGLQGHHIEVAIICLSGLRLCTALACSNGGHSGAQKRGPSERVHRPAVQHLNNMLHLPSHICTLLHCPHLPPQMLPSCCSSMPVRCCWSFAAPQSVRLPHAQPAATPPWDDFPAAPILL